MKQTKTGGKNAKEPDMEKFLYGDETAEMCLLFAYAHRTRAADISAAACRIGLSDAEMSELLEYLEAGGFILKKETSFRITDKGRNKFAGMSEYIDGVAAAIRKGDKGMTPDEARMDAYDLFYRGATESDRVLDSFKMREKKILLKIYLNPNTTRDDIAKFSNAVEYAELYDDPDRDCLLEDSEYTGYALSDTLEALARLIPDFVSEESEALTLTAGGRRAVSFIMEDAEGAIESYMDDVMPDVKADIDAEVFMRRSDVDMAAYYWEDAFLKLSAEAVVNSVRGNAAAK
jgi:hypothetical protein